MKITKLLFQSHPKIRLNCGILLNWLTKQYTTGGKSGSNY